jgi:hypothetical protein
MGTQVSRSDNQVGNDEEAYCYPENCERARINAKKLSVIYQG